MSKYVTWDDYFNDQPPRGKEMLEELRLIFKQTLPEGVESWGYGVPAYDLVPKAKLDKKIMIAGFKNHIGFYPTPEVIRAFEMELKAYTLKEGTVQIKHNQEVPIELIKKMILYKFQQITKKVKYKL